MTSLSRMLSALTFGTLLAVTPALSAQAQAAPPATSPRGDLPSMKSPTGPGGRSITAFDRNAQSGIGGYYDIEFLQPFAANTRGSYFDQHHLILQTSSYLHENLLFNAEIEFEHGGVLNTGFNDGELRIEQAWADWRISDGLGLRAGVMLVPFGIVNILHDSDVRDTTARPLMANAIIPTTWMEPGIGAHGVLYPTESLMVSYDATLTNGLTDQISAGTGLRSARPSLKGDNNGNKAVAGRVGVSPWLGLEVGLDGYYGAIDTSGTRGLWMGGLDLAWTSGAFELVGEWARVGTPGGTTVMTGKTVASALPTDMGGYYVEGRYRFFPSFLKDTFLGAGGGFERATFTLFARGGAADTDLQASDASDKVEMVVGINYRPIQTFVPKVELRRISEPVTGKTDDTLWVSVAAGF